MQYLHGLSYIILCKNRIPLQVVFREEHVGGTHPEGGNVKGTLKELYQNSKCLRLNEYPLKL